MCACVHSQKNSEIGLRLLKKYNDFLLYFDLLKKSLTDFTIYKKKLQQRLYVCVRRQQPKIVFRFLNFLFNNFRLKIS